jgi:hypothetical protein
MTLLPSSLATISLTLPHNSLTSPPPPPPHKQHTEVEMAMLPLLLLSVGTATNPGFCHMLVPSSEPFFLSGESICQVSEA